jgi:hypothetical protein
MVAEAIAVLGWRAHHPGGGGYRKFHLPASMRRSPSVVMASPSRDSEIRSIDFSLSRTSREIA